MSESNRKHPATKRYPAELRERAVRMVLETVDQTGDSFGVVTGVARQLGISSESLRGWVTELIRPKRPWRTADDVELATAGWVHWWNTSGLHGACGDVPPHEYEAANYRRKHEPEEAA